MMMMIYVFVSIVSLRFFFIFILRISVTVWSCKLVFISSKVHKESSWHFTTPLNVALMLLGNIRATSLSTV